MASFSNHHFFLILRMESVDHRLSLFFLVISSDSFYFSGWRPETSTIAPYFSASSCGLDRPFASPTDSISPFICTDSSEAPDSSDGPPSQDPYVATVARWRSRVTARPSSSEFPIAPVTAPPGIRRRSATLIRPGEAIDLM
ncbi:hypothetical protein Tco_0225948 [Tanacetum coccineum]|uniref:Uncharacterized protein n=1 Tax=Tanacetum coccineum TaxID=301880 RepID=A0ABQ4Y7L0_9ASTR